MIEINLLPGARRKKSVARSSVDFKALAAGMSGKVRDKFLIGSVAATLVGVVAFAVLYFSQSRRASALDERREAAVRDSTRYANFLKDRYHAEAVRDTLLRQVNIIKSLDEDRYVWPHVMDEISRTLPQYTWLTLIGFVGAPQGGQNNVVVTPKAAEDTSAAAKKKNRPPKRLDTEIPKDTIKIRIIGRTVDIQAMTRFWKDLEASPYFANIGVDKVEPAVDQGKETYQFQLTIGYTRPDTLLLHRVPLALSAIGAAGISGATSGTGAPK